MTALLQIWLTHRRPPTDVEKVLHSPTLAELEALLDQRRADGRGVSPDMLAAAAVRRATLTKAAGGAL